MKVKLRFYLCFTHLWLQSSKPKWNIFLENVLWLIIGVLGGQIFENTVLIQALWNICPTLNSITAIKHPRCFNIVWALLSSINLRKHEWINLRTVILILATILRLFLVARASSKLGIIKNLWRNWKWRSLLVIKLVQ